MNINTFTQAQPCFTYNQNSEMSVELLEHPNYHLMYLKFRPLIINPVGFNCNLLMDRLPCTGITCLIHFAYKHSHDFSWIGCHCNYCNLFMDLACVHSSCRHHCEAVGGCALPASSPLICTS